MPLIAEGVSSWHGQLPSLDRLQALLAGMSVASPEVGLELAERLLAVRPPEEPWTTAMAISGLSDDSYRRLVAVVASGLRPLDATSRLQVFMRAATPTDTDDGLVGQAPDFDEPARYHRDPRVALALVLASETERALSDGDVDAIDALIDSGRSLAVRVAVHAVHRQGSPELASRVVGDGRALNVQQAYREVGRFARDRFPDFSPQARQAYLSWIEDGPAGTVDPEAAARSRGLRLQPLAPYLEGDERRLLEQWPLPCGRSGILAFCDQQNSR